MNKEFNGFDEMVEALEENEDMVECKECFELFPKVDCERSDIGYVCPVCRGLRTPVAQARFVDPYDSYTQDFPEVTEYDPDSVVEYEKEPGLGDALADLIKDEYEAIDGYEVADETVQHADIDEDEKDEILDTLDHIKEEEEEHIDELKELCPDCDPEEEPTKESEEVNEKLEEAADDEATDEEPEAEEIPEEEAEDSEETENEEVLDLDSAYEAAFEIANESGVGQVFGYARKETEEFVAIEPFEVDDPEAVEDDLMAVYDDVAYAYVAYPEKSLEESLFESVQLHEASFLTNLFTKENQTLNAFFTSGFAVKVGNSTVQTLQNWADAEKLATQKSKANPKEVVSVSAVKVSADELKNAGWSAQLVNEFGDKDFVIATYRNGKVTLVDKAAALTKRLKAEIKSNKIMNKAGVSSSEYNDQYGRVSITDTFKDSKVVPTAATVVKLTNILFDKYTVFQGVAHPMSDEAKSSGSDIQITEVKALGEFTDLGTAVKTAAGKSSRVQEEGSGDAPVAEIYGHFKDFDDEILTYLEKYLTRSPIGALDDAKSAGGPVHLFTYSMGKAIQDEGCISLHKIIKYEKNILEDLEEAGIDVSGKPGIKPPKKAESPEEDTDLDLEGESEPEGDTSEDPKEKLKAILGDKKDPAGYTAESYAKYEALYKKIIAWIDGLKKPEAVTDEKIEGYKSTAESKLVEDPGAGDAELDLNDDDTPEEATDTEEVVGDTSEDTADETTDETDTTDTEEHSEETTSEDEVPETEDEAEEPEEETTDSTDEPVGKLSEVSEEQLKKLYTAVTGQGVGDNKKWQKVLARMRAKLQELGESLDPQDYKAEDFIEEELSSEAEVAKSLKDTQATLKSTADSLKNMTSAMHEEYHKYANPAELTAMDNLRADVAKIVNQVITDLVATGYDDLDCYDSDCYMSGNNTCTITTFIGSEDTFEAGETEDLQDHMATRVEDALAQIKLPPEIVKIQGGAMFPDNLIMDDEDTVNGVTRGEITVEVTFARNLM